MQLQNTGIAYRYKQKEWWEEKLEYQKVENKCSWWMVKERENAVTEQVLCQEWISKVPYEVISNAKIVEWQK